MINIYNRLENESDFEWKLRLCKSKINKEIDIDWSEIVDILGIDVSSDHLRKVAYGLVECSDYYENNKVVDSNLDAKLTEIRKERMKLQTVNMERLRLDRQEARQELYYEYIGNACTALPLPKFETVCTTPNKNMKYVLSIADIHYGAEFESINNVYSTEIATLRFEHLLDECISFVNSHNVDELTVLCLGDCIQGILRVNDLKLNDSTVVKATVEVSRLIATFINDLSKYCKVNYYHVPTANHSQTRNLGTKANELAGEDLEYIIGNYIKDLCRQNNRITVNLADDGQQYISVEVHDFNILAGHGHTIKNIDSSINDLSMLYGEQIDYLMLGHFHGGKSFVVNESITSDTEVIVCPSFIGSDPYSDSLMRGSKAASLICGFDSTQGHIETYKILLN